MTAKALAFVVATLVLPHHHYHHPSTILPVDALCFSLSPILQEQERDFLRRSSHRSSPRSMRVYLDGTSSDDNDDGSGNDDDNQGDDDITIPSLTINGTVNRRHVLLLPSVAVLMATTINSIILNRKNVNKDNIGKYFTNVLESASLYRIKTTPNTLTAASTTTTTNSTTTPWKRGETLLPIQKPSVYRLTNQRLLKDLLSKRAVFLGEHHPDGRDHLIQAALIRSLYYNYDRMNNHRSTSRSGDSITTTTSSSISRSNSSGSPVMAVGIEAVQQQFQPALDAYIAGAINDNELKEATEWESRWYWSFDVYRPILKTCRDLGLPLLALDISTEDRIKVETRGLESIDSRNYAKYIPDPDAFLEFGTTKAYLEYVNYTLKPPYELQSRIKSSSLGRRSGISKNRGNISNDKSDITFSNFVARQMLRDEGMASASTSWLLANPTGLLVGCIGINHATFGCGVPGRVARTLSSSSRIPDECGKERVVSILINPEPLNTGTELNICNKDGTLLTDEEDENEDGYWKPIFAPNKNNQVCIQNSVELQNYALQLEYVSVSLSSTNTTIPTSQQRRQSRKEAASVMQAIPGENVLALSDYLIFSPRGDR